MGVDAERFRKRARECRDLIPRTTDADVRNMLAEVASELEAEAKKLDAEEDPNPSAARH